MVVALPAVELAAILAAAILAAFVTVAAILLTPILKWVGDQIPLVGGWAASKLIDGIQYIRGQVLDALHASIHALTVTLAAIGMVFDEWVNATVGAVNWTVTGLEHLALHGIHAVVAAMIAGLIHGLHALEATVSRDVREIRAAASALDHTVVTLEHDVTGTLVPGLAHLANDVIPGIRQDIAGLEGTVNGVLSSEIAKALAMAGATAATVATIETTLRDLSPLRCGNVGTLARFLCGLDPALLQMLLAFVGDALVLELLAKADVSPSDVFGWAGTGLSDLETIVATF